MKQLNFSYRFLLILSAFLMTANSAFANSESDSQITSEKVATFNPDRNTKSVYTEEISVGETFQSFTEDRLGFSGYSELNTIIIPFRSHKTLTSQGFTHLCDQRKILEESIFPFHFFW